MTSGLEFPIFESSLWRVLPTLFLCFMAQGCSRETGEGGLTATDGSSAENTPSEITFLPAQYSWEPPPEQVAAQEGFLDVGGAKLWYWDTSGTGETVIFSHPASGSALTWKYQQPFLAGKGYRVIAYSRRGHFQSEITDRDNMGTGADDLLQLADHLGVDQFHLVAIAAGADIAPDFAISYPERLLSLVIGSTIGRPGDPEYSTTNGTLMPPEFSAWPTWLKELSTFYRGANPDGAIAWREISDLARQERVSVLSKNDVTPELIASIDLPTLLFTGDSDLYMPPARLRAYAEYWADPDLVIFRGAGHAPYWEQPLAFNQMLLDFMSRNSLDPVQVKDQTENGVRWMPAQTEWKDIPTQAPVTEGYVDVDGVKLWYWDTGGDGDPVVLMHPLTGSAAIWGYQQPELVAAGFRVIAYSRRGHYKSDAGPRDRTGNSVDDLQAVADQLGLDKFHLVGSAGGGFITPDYALTHPERLLSITIACSTAAVTDARFREVYAAMLRTPEIIDAPAWLKELGPSYRAANPEGVAAWRALEEFATPNGPVSQGRINDLNWDAFARIRTPTLLMTADADTYMPPTRLLELAAHMTSTEPEVVILSESGHSGYWEQPEAFNKVLIDFLGRHQYW
jgi:pimeloyl-ACP methyl ester carboxylesterase